MPIKADRYFPFNTRQLYTPGKLAILVTKGNKDAKIPLPKAQQQSIEVSLEASVPISSSILAKRDLVGKFDTIGIQHCLGYREFNKR